MADLAARTDLDELVGNSTGAAGDLALRAATAAIVSAIHWDPRRSERAARATPAGLVILPALNVTAVAVTDPAGLTVPTNTYTWDADGRIHFGTRPRWAPTATITYTAGWPPEQMPDVFEIVCLEEAARWLGARGQRLRSRSWTLGAESETESYDLTAAASLAADKRLAAYTVDPAVA